MSRPRVVVLDYGSGNLRSAERAVARLVEECRPRGPLHARSPGAVARVRRTGRWLLHALARLRRELDRLRSDGARK